MNYGLKLFALFLFYGVGDLISDANLTDQENTKLALRGEVFKQVWMN